MKIGFLCNQISSGGGSASLLLMIKALKNHEIFVLSSNCHSKKIKKKFIRYTKKTEVDVRIKQFVSCAGTKPTFTSFFKAKLNLKLQLKIISDFIKKNKIEILHVNNSVFSHLYAGIKAKNNIRIVSHIRERVNLYNNNFLQNYIVNKIGRYSDKIICISDNEAAPFINSYKKKIYVIPNPYDFDSLKFFDRDIKNQDEIAIGMMGRFSRDKGHMLFLKAANYIIKLNKYDNLKFSIIGVNRKQNTFKLLLKKIFFISDYLTELEKFIKKNSLENSVNLIEYTENVVPLLNYLDIYVRPSLFKDPWGRDIIEAMALKKIVIATGKDNTFVKHNKTGYLSDSLSYRKLAENIIYVIENLNSNKKISDDAFKLVNNICNLTNYKSKIENVYSK